jgi:EAL domain-containing protein (putative c-di-GMP-specific phosphodiesterase class I)
MNQPSGIEEMREYHAREIRGRYKFERICSLSGSNDIIGYEILSCEQYQDWSIQDISTIKQIGLLSANLIGSVSINLSSDSILKMPDSLIESAAKARPNLIIEWVEDRCPSSHVNKAAEKLGDWRERFGIRISIDDMGRGQDGVERFLAVIPDFAKIEGSILHGARKNKSFKRAISYLCGWCAEENVPTIAEWIETEYDMELALSCGATLGQGYYFEAIAAEHIVIPFSAGNIKNTI